MLNIDTKENDYSIPVGIDDNDRLTLMNSFLENISLEHLTLAGVKKGHTIVDLGCGNGAMTLAISRLVGENGCVLAIDGSQEQLEVAKEYLSKNAAKNVHFFHSNLKDDKIFHHIKTKADFIFSRFVFMHQTNPLFILKQAKKLLKPHGKLVSEEPMPDKLSIPHIQKAVETHYETTKKLYQHIKQDFLLYKKMHDLCIEAGFMKVSANEQKVPVTLKELKMLLKNTKSMLLNHHKNYPDIISHDFVSSWLKAIDSLPDDASFTPHSIWCLTAQNQLLDS